MENNLLLALDLSTKCSGVALFEMNAEDNPLKLLHHVTPKVKADGKSKIHEIFEKVEIFEKEFLNNYITVGITRVVIEEPLLQSNNINTVATLLRFNGMIAKLIYDKLGIVPDFISSYDARKYAFPELMAKRTTKKDGTLKPQKEIDKSEPVLFGEHPFLVDKKAVIWELVSDKYPQIDWPFDKNKKLKKEAFDMSDAATVGLAFFNMQKLGLI